MTHQRWLLVLGAVSASALVTIVAVPSVSSPNVLADCALTFDNSAALGAISDQAAGTFAPSYRMGCSSHFLNVESVTWPHFHLIFEDPTIDGCFIEADGITGIGRLINGQCVAPDWDHEPRYLASHKNDKWIKIWLENGSNHEPRAFDLRRMHVGAGPPIQLWFQKQDGSWWFWDQLKAGNWKLEPWSTDVMEVRIRGSSGSSGPYVIRNAYVKP